MTSNKTFLLSVALAIVALAVLPAFVYPVFLMKVMCFAVYALSVNLLLGYVGLLSFGHAMFFGGAAYIFGWLTKEQGLTPELGLVASVLFASGLGAIVGLLAIRRLGIYFSMITLALSQLVYFFFVQAPFTGGEDGLQAIPRGALFGLISLEETGSLYVFVATVCMLAFLLVWKIVYSPFGNILMAIRENEVRAVSLGYRAERYKLGAFIASAGFAGLAGALKAMVFQLASLTDVTWQMSGEPILMIVLGGVGTMLGPIVGAAVVTSLEQYLASSSLPIPVVIGTIFVACVMAFQRGLVGEVKAAAEAARRWRPSVRGGRGEGLRHGDGA
ncbi:branched-chain amino acid ABC transporter permease [Xenophilus azovorans]|uniref:branched-chain amino acid ABC transporter permease n=1 Tax=Xenophilus azovorans TaxID=151755 RepID=UPI000A04531F|nr:branched-chain amino acid ABC transporter permease [Xenophilus azovorans]